MFFRKRNKNNKEIELEKIQEKNIDIDKEIRDFFELESIDFDEKFNSMYKGDIFSWIIIWKKNKYFFVSQDLKVKDFFSMIVDLDPNNYFDDDYNDPDFDFFFTRTFISGWIKNEIFLKSQNLNFKDYFLAWPIYLDLTINIWKARESFFKSQNISFKYFLEAHIPNSEDDKTVFMLIDFWNKNPKIVKSEELVFKELLWFHYMMKFYKKWNKRKQSFKEFMMAKITFEE